MLRLVLPLALLVGYDSAGQEDRPIRQLPTPTATDPKLTEQSRELEQQLCDAILRKDGEALDPSRRPPSPILVRSERISLQAIRGTRIVPLWNAARSELRVAFIDRSLLSSHDR